MHLHVHYTLVHTCNISWSHTHTCTHVHTCTHAHKHLHTHMHACTHAPTWNVRTRAHTCTHVPTYTYVCTRILMHPHTCALHTCTYLHMCLHRHVHTCTGIHGHIHIQLYTPASACTLVYAHAHMYTQAHISINNRMGKTRDLWCLGEHLHLEKGSQASFRVAMGDSGFLSRNGFPLKWRWESWGSPRVATGISKNCSGCLREVRPPF